MNKKVIPFLALALTACTLASCGPKATGNAEKPLVFFNRQPSDTKTGKIDSETMKFNDNTYYVGFDAAGGGAVQGKMITDYLQAQDESVDKNSDGQLGYVLAIGDAGHNDSKARTEGIRKALGTWNGSTDAGKTKTGSIKIGEKTYEVVELESKEMKNDAGATWDASTAANAFGGWYATHKNKIDFVVSNNDGMAMGMLNNSSFPEGTPIFGYDANGDALEAIKAGKLTGTISQNVDAQAAGTLQVIRNVLDGETGENVIKKGISEKDKYGNKISAEMKYVAEDRALLALNAAVTSANIDEYYNPDKTVRDAGIKQIDGDEKKVLLTLYNASDNFLSSSYKPALDYYAKLMKLDLNIVEGDGQDEGVILNKFVNLGNYDAYAINMVKTDSGSQYTDKLA